ncbi:sel1 repeat family protein [Luteimonas fraxinea]|uniref:Sel1 repeat family protein n=1 Tax=Luteimonas fraxinea TaxID=2901869 RepID=A0ABS8UIV5_9GAMM|nr:sel1 repeat family protein [Luteimonas fraxinea]MCD9098917.1 sel1 repeat family protein [Luteimonas fraxinea]MCD9127624.1 sel1 repeat family protein [Luteimonas fraxinea]UHH08687.1 sel1 repeat family protein [Luteimonas fraxinea]
MRWIRKTTTTALTALALAVAALPGSASAQEVPDAAEQQILDSAGFLAAHPDLENRGRGWAAYNRGEHAEAMTYFRRGARYADKPSQGMVAEMIWKGEGAPRDPALAYAWMDLAAERGYEGFTILRERYWQALDAAQREEAIEKGQAVYAEFGDAVAQPRIAAVLRRARRQMTGSRVGMSGNLRIEIAGPGGISQSIDGSKYYAEKFWEPEAYQAWHDAVWKKPLVGRVDVGDVEPVRAPTDRNDDKER